MKKQALRWIALVLALVMSLSLAACSSKQDTAALPECAGLLILVQHGFDSLQTAGAALQKQHLAGEIRLPRCAHEF